MKLRERLFQLLQKAKAEPVDSVPFPCAPGDTIYDIYEIFNETPFPNPAIDKWVVTNITCWFDKKGNMTYEIDGRMIPAEEFGKTVFLSEEEAQEAIKRGLHHAR